MHNGSWAVIFGSGYSDASHGSNKAALFIVDAITGTLIKEIVLDSSGSNGLSTPAVIDTDADFEIGRAHV